MLNQLEILYGTTEAPDEELILEAGALRAVFVRGALRNISYQGVEVIRGIHFLVRDRNWSTVVPVISQLVVETSSTSFSLRFNATGHTPSDNQSFTWQGRILADAVKGLRFEVEGAAEEDFLTCRTGFVILHPLDKTAGCPVTLLHSDGRESRSVFPDLVDPLQSFFDLVGISHSPLPGVTATCRMEGGIWETEDHRNWLDASFKTYFRPLSLSWPYTVPKGEKIKQSVELSFTGTPAIQPKALHLPTVSLGDRTGNGMPDIGLSVEVQDLPATLAVATKIKDLSVQYLVFRFRSDTADLPGALRLAAQITEVAHVRASLEIVVAERGSAAQELDLVAIAARVANFHPDLVAVCPAMDLQGYPPSVDRPIGALLEDIYNAALEAFPGVPLSGGTFSYFTELNRRHPPLHLMDMVQHATTSVNHAADDRSVMETLETLPHIFRSVRHISGPLPYRVGPVNIGMVHNPYGASLTPNPQGRRQSMARQDPRHHAQFGAAWAAGYLARVVQAGLQSVTIMSPVGDFGLLDRIQLPPAACVIQVFAELAGGATLQASSSQPQSLLAVAAEVRGQRVAILANLTPKELEVQVSGWPLASASLLSANSLDKFDPFKIINSNICALPPFAVARLKG